MKWFQVALAGATFLGEMPNVNAKYTKGGANLKTKESTRRVLKKSDTSDESSDSGSGDTDVCPTCNEQLPGYSLFGDFYFDKDFYEGPDPDKVTEPLVGKPGLSCYDMENIEACYIATFLSEAIYTNDLTRCLLLSLAKTARESICFLQDVEGLANMDVVGGNVYPSNRELTETQKIIRRHLADEEGAVSDAYAPILEFLVFTGTTTASSLLNGIGIDVEGIFEQAAAAASSAFGRKLAPDIRSGDGDLDFNDELDAFLTPDFVQGLTGNAFFFKCTVIYGADLGFCLAVFTLLKTIDASICYYQEELGCSVTDSCTDDLKFTTEYNARRLANYIPPILSAIGLFPPEVDPTNFLLADILAPCGPCAEAKSDGCSAFCNYVDGFHTCDPIRRAWWDNSPFAPTPAPV
jgi:hypothetical protein